MFYRLCQAAKIGGALLMSALLLWATSGMQNELTREDIWTKLQQLDLHEVLRTLEQAAGALKSDLLDRALFPIL